MSETTPGPYAMVPSLRYPLFVEEPSCARAAWTDLCSLQASSRREIWIAGRAVRLEVHELAATVRFLADRWQWSKSKVWRFLQKLERDKLITVIGTGSWDRRISVYRIEFPGWIGVPEVGEWDAPMGQVRDTGEPEAAHTEDVRDVQDVRDGKRQEPPTEAAGDARRRMRAAINAPKPEHQLWKNYTERNQ